MNDFTAADELFTRFWARHPVPGLVYAAVTGGKVVHHFARGVCSVESREPVSSTTRFRIASMTKSFAAAATLALRDARQLALHETVADLLPGVPLSERLKRLTVSSLLTMTADLPTDDPWGDRKLGRSDAEYASLYAEDYSWAGVGDSSYSYSNLGYMLLGRILSVVSGVHAHRLIEDRILTPLGMHRTGWNPPARGESFADAHEKHGTEWRALPMVPCRGDGDVFAGLWTTAEDLAIWIRFMSSAWDPCGWDTADRILAPASRRALQQEQAFMSDSLVQSLEGDMVLRQRSRYAFGLWCTQIGDARFVAHSGGLPGYGSHMRWHVPSGLGIVAFANGTYTPVSRACERALEYLVRKTERPTGAPPVVTQAGTKLWTLVRKWDENLARELFADNFFQDNNGDEFKERCRALRDASHRNGDHELNSLGALRGELRWEATGSFPVVVEFLVAPGAAGQIQKVDFWPGCTENTPSATALTRLQRLVDEACFDSMSVHNEEFIRTIGAALGLPLRIDAIKEEAGIGVIARLKGTFGKASVLLQATGEDFTLSLE